MKGLEVSILPLAVVLADNRDKRLDSRYFSRAALAADALIECHNPQLLVDISSDIRSFGAYALTNEFEYQEDGIPFLRGTNYFGDFIKFTDVLRISQEAHELLYKSEVTPGMVLLSMSGSVGIHFEVMRRNGGAERVSLRQVCIRPRPINSEHRVRNNHEYRVRKIAGGDIEISVVAVAAGIARFQHTQQTYDPNSVYLQAGFVALSGAQQVTLRELYDGCNPRPMVDLVQGGGPALQAGAMAFQCIPEDLLAGLVEIIYTMRNALLHGEVDPDPQVLACYEPAYRIVMHFLKAVQ